MTKHIPAKPTKYDGIQYRSRLEAGWAVYWKQLMLMRNVEYPDEKCSVNYETFSSIGDQELAGLIIGDRERVERYAHSHKYSHKDASTLILDIQQYRPDFRVRVDRYVFFLELKPVYPNQFYMDMLTIVQERIACIGSPLILVVGGLRDDKEPEAAFYPYTSFSDAFSIIPYTGKTSGHREAYELARNFRWDLHQEG